VYMKVDEWKEKVPAFFSKPSDHLKRFRIFGLRKASVPAL